MKKIFEAEYGDDLARQVSDWIEDNTLASGSRNCQVFRPYAVVELFDQHGKPVKQ